MARFIGPVPLVCVGDHAHGKGPGVFLLSRGSEPVGRVGRAEVDLLARLHDLELEQDERTGYNVVRYCFTKTAAEAYALECEVWHAERPKGQAHPARPVKGGLRCPVAKCPES